MDKKYISLDRARQLQDSIGFLDNYKPVDNESLHVGDSIDVVDKEMTDALTQLGEINKTRDELIKKIHGK